MIGYRVTKYNPENRDEQGRYLLDEWTGYCDVGGKFNNKKFTYNDYITIEEKYITTVMNLLQYHNVKTMTFLRGDETVVDDDENSTSEMRMLYSKIKRKINVDVNEIPDLMKLILREYIWGILKSEKVEVYFGYDYYMYIGLLSFDDNLMNLCVPSGMYYERHVLPTGENE